MANWGDNYVCFKAELERVRQVYELFASLAALELTEGFGKLPDFVDEPDGFFVEIKVLDDGIEYQTRWLPNGDAVRKVADHFGVDYFHRYWENGCQLYGLEIYKDGLLVIHQLGSPFLLDPDEYDEQEDEVMRICRDAFCD